MGLPEELVVQHGKVHFRLFLKVNGLSASEGFRKLCSDSLTPSGSITGNKGSMRLRNYLVLPSRSKSEFELWRWCGNSATLLKFYPDLREILDMALQMAKMDEIGQSYDPESIAPRTIRAPKESVDLSGIEEEPTRRRSRRSRHVLNSILPPTPEGYVPYKAGFRQSKDHIMGAIQKEGTTIGIVAGRFKGIPAFRAVDFYEMEKEQDGKSRPSELRPLVQHFSLDAIVKWVNEWPASDVKMPTPQGFTGSLTLTTHATPVGHLALNVSEVTYNVAVQSNLEILVTRGRRRGLEMVSSWSDAMDRIIQDAASVGVTVPLGTGTTEKSAENHPWFDYHYDPRQ